MELLAVFPPLVGFFIAGLFGRQIGDRGAQLITSAGVVLAAFASLVLFFDVIIDQDPRVIRLMPWIISGDFQVFWALRVDQLSVVMMCVVNIVSACVHVYSIGYMSHDPDKPRFMAYLSLFTFTMLMLVTSDNLLQLFFGWEGVGVASYLLIGFWAHKHTANAAAVKAFIMNRIGDFGLMLGIMGVFFLFGTINFDEIFAAVPSYTDATLHFFGQDIHALTLIGLALFVGAMGKSAQLGLHTWLPDAMEGPTPVSALIHAATMVTAGVFLVARFSPFYEYAPDALAVIAVLGALTAFIAATIGMTQFDIKRVIAYSTMSQLGYMFFALGVSAYGAAVFHLMTHAFFKALLFLSAGSVIHAMSDEQDMRKMGGIWRKIPMTYVMMWIGSLALAGVPFFAGYYSKDIILEAAFAADSWQGMLAYALGIAAAIMTAFYSWRLLFMTFHGKPRASKKVMDHVHESPPVMMGPLVILATGALFAGAFFYAPFVGGAHHENDIGQDIVHEVVEATHHGADVVHELEGFSWDRDGFWGRSLFVLPAHDSIAAAHNVPWWVKRLPIAAGALGIALAWLFYIRYTGVPGWFVRHFSILHQLFFRKWYFDRMYGWAIVRLVSFLGHTLWKKGDRAFIDRYGPDGIAMLSDVFGRVLSRLQTGYVYHYAFVMLMGLVLLLGWVMFDV